MRHSAALILAMSLLAGCTTTSTSFTTPYSTQTESVNSETDKRDAARNRVGIAYEYIRNGEFERAKFHLDKAVEQDPKSEYVQVGLAWYYQQVKEIKLAKSHYKQALKLNDKNPSTLNNYGIFLCEQGDYKESVNMFISATEIFANKDISGTFENAGFCSAKGGNYEQAEEYYRRALNYNSQQRLALLGMAEIEFRKKRHERTRAYLQRYESVASHSPRSLWLGAQNAAELSDLDALASYGLKLEQMFPDSQETEYYLDAKTKWLR